MKWLTDVLERNGIVPSTAIAEQVIDAIPRGLLRQVAGESAAAVLAMRGIRDAAGDFARELGAAMARSVELALRVGELDDDDDGRVVDVIDDTTAQVQRREPPSP